MTQRYHMGKGDRPGRATISKNSSSAFSLSYSRRSSTISWIFRELMGGIAAFSSLVMMPLRVLVTVLPFFSAYLAPLVKSLPANSQFSSGSAL